MRILFITPYVPSLIRVRPFNFIKQLSKRHEVVLVSLVQGEKDAAALDQVRQYCEKVYAFPLSKARSLISCCRRLLSRTPLQAAYTDLPSARQFVTQIAGSEAFDLLHVEHIRGAHLAEDVGFVPRVYDSVDCITRLLKQALTQRPGAFQRALGYEELVKMRTYEPEVASTFDGVVITSERDRRALEWLIRRLRTRRRPPPSGAQAARRSAQRRRLRSLLESYQDSRLEALGAEPERVAVVGNGVDSEYFRPMPGEACAGRIVFSGKMSYFANASGALRFYHEVFPRIRQRRPDATFKVVGSDPPEAVRQLAKDPAVDVTGYLPDIRPALASAEVVVCPLTIGVGIQNKVLEAMSMGKPVVATSLACSGIPDAVDGRDLMRTGEAPQMAGAVVDLLDDPRRGQELGERARRFVRERYSWEAAVQKLEAVYARAVGTRKQRVLAAA